MSLTVAVSLAIGAVVSPGRVTRYTATAYVMATVGSTATPATTLDQSVGLIYLLPTYAQLAHTLSVATAAADAADRTRSPGQVLAELTAAPLNATQLIVLRIEDRSDATAQLLVRAAAAAFVRQYGGVRPPSPAHAPVTLRVAAPVAAVDATSRDDTAQNLLAAAVLGLVVALALAGVVDYLDPAVRDPLTAARRAGCPVLSVIPNGWRPPHRAPSAAPQAPVPAP